MAQAEHSPARLFYTPLQIAVATFAFSAAAGFWFVSRNMKVFGASRMAARAVRIGGFAGALVLLLGSLYLPPGFMPAHIVNASVAVGLYVFLRQYQGGDIRAAATTGLARASNWRVAGTGFALLLALLASAYFILATLIHFDLYTVTKITVLE